MNPNTPNNNNQLQPTLPHTNPKRQLQQLPQEQQHQQNQQLGNFDPATNYNNVDKRPRGNANQSSDTTNQQQQVDQHQQLVLLAMSTPTCVTQSPQPFTPPPLQHQPQPYHIFYYIDNDDIVSINKISPYKQLNPLLQPNLNDFIRNHEITTPFGFENDCESKFISNNLYHIATFYQHYHIIILFICISKISNSSIRPAITQCQ
jgi:hypothetical protein